MSMLKPSLKTHIGKLQQKKFRKEFQEFTIEGVKGVEEALNYGTVLAVIVEGNRRDEPELARIISLAEKKDVGVEYCGHKDIDAIKSTETFPGVMAIVELPDVELVDLEEKGTILALDGVKDPGNLGTIIRTADWFGVHAVLLSEDSVDPYNEKCVRSTMGSIFRVHIFKTFDLKETLKELKEKKWQLNTFTMSGKSLSQIKKGENAVYIFGSESHGVSKEIEALCDEKYTIPGNTQAESLNLSIASGIVLWEINR